ncbi:hypothetical protein SD71_18995 [Cohnella kolymensis]|uniref:Ribokinase n=1 Tax=Cohnella kolymensis TaxID=1590652 RepID=A0ABR5A0G4_9BACL|nr:ribokinase [Cohnella kolymensis]KIL34558.1 hypothetical protein SD71_18995 [Cohnella kolymensis]
MGRKSSVTVIGSYNVGLIAQAARLPEWGETVFGSGFSECPGGKGSNQAVAAARLGGDVRFIGCIGTDRYGDDAVSMLTDEGVDISRLKRSTIRKTGVGFVFLNEHGDNCIIVDPGANMELLPEDIEAAQSAIAEADVVLFQLESHLDTVRHAMKMARDMSKVVIFNPAPAQTELDSILPFATYVTPNESELKIMSGRRPDEQLTDSEYIDLAREVLRKGPEAVIITLGEKGAMVVSADSYYTIPAILVDAVDTTGAGDSFNAALAVALGEGQSLEEAVHFACCVGAYTVIGHEVIPALPTREQISLFMSVQPGGVR